MRRNLHINLTECSLHYLIGVNQGERAEDGRPMNHEVVKIVFPWILKTPRKKKVILKVNMLRMVNGEAHACMQVRTMLDL